MEDTGSDHVLVAMEGEAHQAWRKTLQPAFSRDALAPRFGAMVASMRSRIATLPTNADTPLLELMQDLVSNASGVAMVGCPVGKLLGATSRFAHTALGAGVGGFPVFFRHLPRYRLARTQVFDFLRGVIAARRDAPETGDSPPLLDALLAARRTDGEPLREEDLLANLHIAYTNSLVYVGAIAVFFLHFLLRNPRALEACRAEADQLFGGDALELGRLQRSTWLRASLTETQRLQPISLSAPRAVRVPFTFAGYDFAPGTMTLTATAITHLLPEYFPDPERFDPERCMAPRNEHRLPYAFVPFGLDNHACPAAGLVATLAMTAVGLLLHHLDLEPLSPDTPLRLQIAPFPAPHRDHRFRVRAHRTQSASSSDPRSAPRPPRTALDRRPRGPARGGGSRARAIEPVPASASIRTLPPPPPRGPPPARSCCHARHPCQTAAPAPTSRRRCHRRRCGRTAARPPTRRP